MSTNLFIVLFIVSFVIILLIIITLIKNNNARNDSVDSGWYLVFTGGLDITNLSIFNPLFSLAFIYQFGNIVSIGLNYLHLIWNNNHFPMLGPEIIIGNHKKGFAFSGCLRMGVLNPFYFSFDIGFYFKQFKTTIGVFIALYYLAFYNTNGIKINLINKK